MHGSNRIRNNSITTCKVVYSYYPFDPRVRKEVRALVEKGYDVDIICLRDPDEKRFEEVDGAKVHRLPLTAVRGGYLRYIYQYVMFFMMSLALLIKLHIKKRFDVVHVHSLPDFQVFVAMVPKISGSKIILDLHEGMPEIFAARFNLGMKSNIVKIASFLENVSGNYAHKLITVNDVLKERLVKRFSDPNKIAVIMNSPDERLTAMKDVSQFVKDHDLNQKFLIVFVGGINKERNLEVLIKAVALLKKDLPIYLAIFGYGKDEYKNELRALTQQQGLMEDTHFGGWIPHEYALSYMNLSNVGIISYLKNPLTQVAVPNKVFEFAKLGKPLIIAKLGALENLFSKAALFYEPGNEEDLAMKVLQISSDNELAERLTSKAEEVYEKCKWDLMKVRLVSVYEEMTSKVS